MVYVTKGKPDTNVPNICHDIICIAYKCDFEEDVFLAMSRILVEELKVMIQQL